MLTKSYLDVVGILGEASAGVLLFVLMLNKAVDQTHKLLTFNELTHVLTNIFASMLITKGVFTLAAENRF